MPAAKPVIIIDAADHKRPILPRDLWSYRGLLARMTRTAFQAKYLKLKTSFLWYYVRPLVITLMFVLVRAGANAGQGADAPYPLYVFSGVCFWFIFADMLNAAAGALMRDATLIQKVYFPIVISPLAQVLARLGDVFLAMIAIVALQIWLGVGFDSETLMFAPVLLQLVLLALGLGCIVATLSLTAPDFKEGVSIALMLGLFVSPVYFATSAMSHAAQIVLHINPMAGTLGGLRASLFNTAPFPWAAWSYSCVFTLLALIIGLIMIGRASRNAAESL